MCLLMFATSTLLMMPTRSWDQGEEEGGQCSLWYWAGPILVQDKRICCKIHANGTWLDIHSDVQVAQVSFMDSDAFVYKRVYMKTKNRNQ